MVIQIPKKSSVPSAARINAMIADGKGVTEIAKKYGVSRQRIYQVLKKGEHEDLKKNGVIAPPKGDDRYVDPETGLVIRKNGANNLVMGKMGDEKVSAFIAYHLAMAEMRKGVNKKDPDDMRERFYNYLRYCLEHTILPNNMNCYFAIGINKEDICRWKSGKLGTPEHKAFAEEVSAFFASVHEQAAADALVNPIMSIYWSKAHDGLSDQPRNEQTVDDPLGEKRSEEEIRAKYSDVTLPD